MSKPIRSICILRLSAIGDVCNAVAAVQAIQDRHPSAAVTWIIGKVEYSLLADLPGIEFIVYDKSAGKTANRQFKAEIADKHFDVLLHMQVALRASLLSRHIKAKRRIGFDRQRSKELQSWFINEKVLPRSNPHVLEGFFDFAQALGVSKDALQKPTWNIPIRAPDQAFADKHVPHGTHSLVIVPAASKAERNWLPERYAALANAAADKGLNVLLCGGPSELEQRLAASILSHTNASIQNLIGQSSLKQMLALLKNASLVIAPDTGPAHMAVSQGTPVIGLYAHSNPGRTGPYLYLNYVVEVYHTHLKGQTGKSIDQLPWGKRVKGENIMQDLTVDAVIKQFHQVLADLNIGSE